MRMDEGAKICVYWLLHEVVMILKMSVKNSVFNWLMGHCRCVKGCISETLYYTFIFKSYLACIFQLACHLSYSPSIFGWASKSHTSEFNSRFSLVVWCLVYEQFSILCCFGILLRTYTWCGSLLELLPHLSLLFHLSCLSKVWYCKLTHQTLKMLSKAHLKMIINCIKSITILIIKFWCSHCDSDLLILCLHSHLFHFNTTSLSIVWVCDHYTICSLCSFCKE